ncbi:Thiol methyltransferase 2 [Balamuthia mandrillaris]
MNMEAEAKSTGEEVKGLEQEEVERWEGMWTQDGGLKPGQRFDAERSSLALLHLIDTADPPLPKGRVLVPGCGRGYDLASFVKKGVATEKCVGLEISNSAINAAQHYLDQQLPSELRDKAEIRLHDFFKMHQSEEQERFDLIFDYTFLCAIPPQKRQDWAAQMKRLLKPGGELITLIFPVMEKEGGPPYAMSTELVFGLLKPQGFSLVEEIAPVPPHLSHAGREGKEWLARWAL